MGHKSSLAERKLRPSLSPGVFAVKNDKGHIIGYRQILADSAPSEALPGQDRAFSFPQPQPALKRTTEDSFLYRPEVLKRMERAKQKTLV